MLTLEARGRNSAFLGRPKFQWGGWVVLGGISLCQLLLSKNKLFFLEKYEKSPEKVGGFWQKWSGF